MRWRAAPARRLNTPSAPMFCISSSTGIRAGVVVLLLVFLPGCVRHFHAQGIVTMPCAWKWRTQPGRKTKSKTTTPARMPVLLEIQNIGADGVFSLRAGAARHLIIGPGGADNLRNHFGVVRLVVRSDRYPRFVLRQGFLGAH